MARYAAVRPEVRAYLFDAFSRIPRAGFLNIWSGVARCLHEEPGYTIRQPLLWMHGERDVTGTIRKWAPVWTKRQPDCRYVVIPGAGHVANQDNPEFLNRVLLDFLNDVHARRQPD